MEQGEQKSVKSINTSNTQPHSFSHSVRSSICKLDHQLPVIKVCAICMLLKFKFCHTEISVVNLQAETIYENIAGSKRHGEVFFFDFVNLGKFVILMVFICHLNWPRKKNRMRFQILIDIAHFFFFARNKCMPIGCFDTFFFLDRLLNYNNGCFLHGDTVRDGSADWRSWFHFEWINKRHIWRFAIHVFFISWITVRKKKNEK